MHPSLPARSLLRRTLAVTAASTAVAAGLVSGPPARAADPSSAITVVLKAPDQRGLDRLAVAQGLSHAQRVAALSRLLPSSATRARAVEALQGAGFHVTHQTAWTIDATATPQAVAATFGTATDALGRVPAALSPITAAVLDKSNGPTVFRPRDICTVECHNGRDFRNAYSSPSQVLHRGHDHNGPLTVATIQLPLQGGWNENDITKYATAVGLPDPVASGQYKQIPVDGATVPNASTKEGGADEEVDLDQETILSTAPVANQRAYFDTNPNKAGYADALSQVLADVTQGPGAADGGDPKIAALSTSWGTCESEFSDDFAFPHDSVKAVGNILKSLTAAGVTIFAASGDDGIYDCGDSPRSTKQAVDYPASSPQVVGVGGTRLTSVGNSAANDGTNWVDKAWTCTSAERCQGMKPRDTGGSGGGESKLFAMPAYQKAGIGRQRFKTSTGHKGNFGAQHHRLVPDIAADGDPDTGFAVLTTDPNDVKSCRLGDQLPTCDGKFFAIGGTSLSAPAAAAMFTDMLAANGAASGVGDIHAALYSAYTVRGAFRDVTRGRNGRQRDVDADKRAGKGYELPVRAQPGYDTVTGLGAPLWPELAPYLFAPSAPSATGTVRVPSPHRRKHPSRVTAVWRGTQAPSGGILPATAKVRISRDGAAAPVFSRKHAPATGETTFHGKPGATYTLRVVETDLTGATSAPFTTEVTVP
jgi:hypothetical protein